jgi:Tol biopolymer transport system component
METPGGPISKVCDLPERQPGHGTWSPDGGTIVFFGCGEGGCRLHEVAATGGTPRLLLKSEWGDEKRSVVAPRFLPARSGSSALLFNTGPKASVGVLDLGTKQARLLFDGGLATYSPTGHVVYQPSVFDGSTLWAQPFSLDTLSPTGERFPIAQNASVASVSNDGTLAYTEEIAFSANQLVWRDRTGKLIQAVGQTQEAILFPSLSPDGRSVAVEGEEQGARNIWKHDLERSIKTRLTAGKGRDGWPIWTSDGASITFYQTLMGSGEEIVSQPAEPGGRITTLSRFAPNEGYQTGVDWSGDGRRLVIARVLPPVEPGAPADLWYMERKPDGGFQEVQFTHTPFDEGAAKLSPDDRLLAYSADSSGQNEIYLQRFPEGGQTMQVSRDGGMQPRWSRDGKEIFFVNAGALYTVSVRRTPALALGVPEMLFSNPNLGKGGEMPGYDVSLDGRQFLLVEPVGEPKTVIRVVQNWFAEFEDQAK